MCLGGVAHTLRALLEPHLKSEVRATVLGHVQRGGPPTPYDRILATQFGHQAASLVLQGRFNRMVTLASDTPGSALGDIALSEVADRTRCASTLSSAYIGASSINGSRLKSNSASFPLSSSMVC